MVRIKKAKFAEALKDSGGIITTIANRLGVSRQAIYKYLERFPEFKQDLEDETEKILDMAEISLFSQVKGRDIGATKYLLSTKGKRRGYVEKQEIEHSGNQFAIDINIPLEVKNLLKEEAK